MGVVVEQTSASSLAVPLSGVVAMGWLLTSLSFFTCLKNEDDIVHLIGLREISFSTLFSTTLGSECSVNGSYLWNYYLVYRS